MYRTDLFEDEWERDRFRSEYGYELAVPETWSQFLDIARFFNRPDEGLHGCIVAAYPDGHNSVYDFLIHLWSRGGVFLDEGNRVGFNSPTGKEALQWYVDLIHEHEVTQPNPWEHDSVASGIEFAGGTAAMMWNWTGFAAVADLPEISKIPGKVRVTPIPKGDGPAGRRASLNIYWVLTIPSGSRHKEAAYAFCKNAISAEMDHYLTMVGGNGCRLSTWNDAEVQSAYQYYEVIEEIHRHALTLPRIPELAELLDVNKQDGRRRGEAPKDGGRRRKRRGPGGRGTARHGGLLQGLSAAAVAGGSICRQSYRRAGAPWNNRGI